MRALGFRVLGSRVRGGALELRGFGFGVLGFGALAVGGFRLYGYLEHQWVVVKISVPFLGTLNIRCRIIIRTQKAKKGTSF